MKPTFTSLALFFCFGISCFAESPILPFADQELPSGGPDAWKWVQGDGEITLDSENRIVLKTHSPSASGDNRVSAIIEREQLDWESFVLDISVDPASNIKNEGYNQLDFGITFGRSDTELNLSRFQENHAGLSLNIRDLSDRADYGVFYHGRDLSLPVAVSQGTGHPRAFHRHDGFYRFRMVITPQESGSLVRVYHSQFVTPNWEGTTEERIIAGRVGIYARLGRQGGQTINTTIESLSVRQVDPEIAGRQLEDAESVLYSLNLEHPGLEQVKAAMDRDDIAAATTAFAHYLRHRENVVGPTVKTGPLDLREQRIADLMTQDKLLVYTGGPLFEHQFEDPYDWAIDPYETGGQFAIYNSRMFPWIEMGRAFRQTKDPKYVRTFVKQMNRWLDKIPLRIVATPGNPPFFIDGNTLEPPLLFTGNMGRRIELTWWQTFELFKDSPEFDDASMMRMMKYFQDNARLVTNPSIFFAWDDSGLHMATGLLQCATMMPEWKEAEFWEEVAFDRLEKTFRAQVHPDGTHASLSTGYGWATIDSYSNVFEIMRRNHRDIPPKFKLAIRDMIMSYMSILRPDFGNISLNDGGWSPIDDKVREYAALFPGNEEMAYFASRGEKGKRPEWTSRYFPNAGWYATRTGFGPKEKMLFMDGGPFGASHGKQDALHLIIDCGGSLLLRDGGRGDYTSKPTSVWSSNTLAFNTLSPDWALQDRTHRYEHEKHVGFHPPERPWVSNEEFDYGRSTYDAGWYLPKKKIEGTHTRHVIFLKGNNPPETGYWIVIDQVETTDDNPLTWRHPWHFSTENLIVNEQDQSVTTDGAGANLKIIPVNAGKNVKLEIIKGQREPALQGWRVHGADAKPHAVPIHRWTCSGSSVQAWVLVPRNASQKSFEIESVATGRFETSRYEFTLNREDSGQDHVAILTNPNDQSLEKLAGQPVHGKLAVVRIGSTGRLESVLDVN